MNDKANRMAASDLKPEEVWYVNSRASNHMSNHKEWFSFLEKPEKPGVVETKDNTSHPIKHIGDVPLSHVSQKGIMRNVLYVRTITKNFVSVSQIVEQGMQVRFTHHRCLIEEKGQIIVQGHRDGRMFILETNYVGIAIMCAPDFYGRGNSDNRIHLESDIYLGHKGVTAQIVLRI